MARMECVRSVKLIDLLIESSKTICFLSIHNQVVLSISFFWCFVCIILSNFSFSIVQKFLRFRIFHLWLLSKHSLYSWVSQFSKINRTHNEEGRGIDNSHLEGWKEEATNLVTEGEAENPEE